MSRIYFYLRDSTTGQYQIDRHNELGPFDKAVTFLSEKNAIVGRKARITGYENILSWGKPNKKDPSYEYAMECWNTATRLSKLPNFGIEIVSATVPEPK